MRVQVEHSEQVGHLTEAIRPIGIDQLLVDDAVRVKLASWSTPCDRHGVPREQAARGDR